MTTITALPTPVPTTADPANFDVRADAFLAALPTFATEANTVAGEVNVAAAAAAASAVDAGLSAVAAEGFAVAADDSAIAAAASAASALLAPGTYATSISTMTPSLGVKSFTLQQLTKTFVVGQWVSITDRTTPNTKWMLGPITAFTMGTGAISVNVDQFQGSASSSLWDIAASAPVIVPVPVGHVLYLSANYGIF